MKKPTISVIMPVYNGEKYLAEAIDSVLSQTFDGFEFIVVNDGSTDRTAKILEKYRIEYPWIKIVTLEVNQGISKAINVGLAHANAEYVCFVAADDIQYPNRLEDSYREMVLKKLDILMFEFDMIDDTGNPLGRSMRIPNFLTETNILLEEFKRNYFFSGACLIKFDPKIQFDTNLRTSEDYDWFLRMLMADKKVGFLRKSLLQVRVHKGSLSSNHSYSYEATKYILNKYDFDSLFHFFKIRGFREGEIWLTFAIMCITKEEPYNGLDFIAKIQLEQLNDYELFCKYFYEGVLHGMVDRWDYAYECFNKSSKMKYKNAAVYNNLAVATYWVNRDTSLVTKLLQEALLYQPQYFDASENLKIINNAKEIKQLQFTKRLLRDQIIQGDKELIK
uniref:Glycosyl transferase family 2 n=1 Tax=Geobacillus sp. (strain Y4.1MC1) TaxID=581103 RepID=A0A7U4DJF9_GEOS0